MTTVASHPTNLGQFQAAVKLITNLPKDGPFQPSNDLKLKFYAFFKQATVGPNRTPKPSMFSVVNRAKWDAWTSLGNISKEDAMKGYIDALKQVVETMSVDSNVQDFLEAVGPIYEFVNDTGQGGAKRAVDNDQNRAEIGSLFATTPLDSVKSLLKGKNDTNGNHLYNGNGRAGGQLNGSNGHYNDLRSSMEVLSATPVVNSTNSGMNGILTVETELSSSNGTDGEVSPTLPTGQQNSLPGGEEEETHSDEEFADAREDQKLSGKHNDTSSSCSSLTVVDGCVYVRDVNELISECDSPPVPLSESSPTQQTKWNKLCQTSRYGSNHSGAVPSRLDLQSYVNSNHVGNGLAAVSASSLGLLLSTLPSQIDENSLESYDEIFNQAWREVEKIKVSQKTIKGEEKRLLKGIRKFTLGSGVKRSKGRGDDKREGSTEEGSNRPEESANTPGGAAASGTSPPDSQVVRQCSARNRENSSGSSSKSSSSGELSPLEFDPQIAAVLVRMHKDLQNITKQLQLMENILLTQQHLIRGALSHISQRSIFRLFVFPKLPWRTIFFIIVWPIVVNLFLRFWRSQMLRRRLRKF